MADISKEINDFRAAVYGRDVRESMISLAEKVNEEVETNTTHVDEAVTTANGASQKATKASEEVQKAITEANTTLQEANAAKVSAQESATASAGSASAAAGSASAASGSAANAAASAKAVEDIAAGLGGFDGTATSVKATDTQGIVVAAGADSNAQALLDALARKVALELVSNTALATKLADYLKKTDIVQTESTATNKVPSSAYLKQVKDSIDSNLEWKLNGTYKATDTCPLPEKYNELMIKIYRTSDNAYTCGVNILKAELGKNTGNWMTGCGRDASGWDVKIVIAITSTIAINSVFINAADNKSNFSFVVYYR